MTPAAAGVHSPSPHIRPPRRASIPPHHTYARRGGRPFPISKFITSAVGRCPFPISKFITSATGRCPFPISIHGEGVADRLGVRSIYTKKGTRNERPRVHIYQRLIAIRETIYISLMRLIRISCNTLTVYFIAFTIRYICHITKFTILAI